MTPRDLLRKGRRAIGMPPALLTARLRAAIFVRLDRSLERRLGERFSDDALLRNLGAPSVDALWERLAARPYVADVSRRSADEVPGLESLRERAAAAVRREVDLLGSGPTRLPTPIEWHVDFKTGLGWPLRYGRDLDVPDLGRPSDVKVPWELSRLHWLIPVGQRYLVDGDESDATFVRTVVDEWIDANPYLMGVNWTTAMEVALRFITLTWLFHVFARSDVWRDREFRSRLLRTLFLHARYVARNLERSDINGNHFTADVTALVFAGAFFDEGPQPRRWADSGWLMLRRELFLQVYADGVDFEMSTSYHRLVAELFALAALYRHRVGADVDDAYRARVMAMADFAAAYDRPQGAPLWGDADDARVLPFGTQPITDHGYLPALLARAVRESPRPRRDSGAEEFWLFGSVTEEGEGKPRSSAFRDGGVYVLRGARDHVFIDCGPVGLGGRGGHGHNDCLAVDAVLDGVHLLSDAGSYVYTADPVERNRFRSTAVHNTPQIDGAELNRFVGESLWQLRADAHPELRLWEDEDPVVTFVGAHTGYRRLDAPVTPVRTVRLDTHEHSLAIDDDFEGTGEHATLVSLQLAPGVLATRGGSDRVTLSAAGRRFELTWGASADWDLEIEDGWVSPSYGVRVAAARLVWRRNGQLRSLRLSLARWGGGQDGCGGASRYG
jgi:hypothetical protein